MRFQILAVLSFVAFAFAAPAPAPVGAYISPLRYQQLPFHQHMRKGKCVAQIHNGSICSPYLLHKYP